MGWVLGALEEEGVAAPVAIMPLGTGNDLARVLGWGGGWEGESVADILGQVAEGHIEPLDRWAVTADSGQLPLQHWTNYVSVGADAEVALRFHRHRKHSPGVFFSRIMNKFWYAHHGINAFLTQLRSTAVTPEAKTNTRLHGKLSLFCDEEEVQLPEGTRGVVVANIGSYGGGANGLWAGEGAVDRSDGLVEVVAVTGVLHLTQIQLGLASGIAVARCKEVRLATSEPLAMQIDGEPFVQQKGTMHISFHGVCDTLCRTADAHGEAAAEVSDLLEWGQENGHVSSTQV